MLRRRPATVPTPPPETAAPGPARGALAATLDAGGWVLPRGVRTPGAPSWTLVGTVSSPTATPVDPRGLVVGDGWSLDWWVGADDRWHVPAREAAIRQQLADEAPVVETLLRVPGGDVVHRAYGIRSPRPVGDEWVMVEIENATPIPVAVALVIRPMVADGVGSIGSITIEPVGGRTGRDIAHLVRVDGRPAVVLPRRPARVAVGNLEVGDVFGPVTAGEAGQDLLTAACDQGLASLALVFPLTHTSRLPVAIPVGPVGDGPIDWPAVVPDAATVVSGWEAHRRGPRFEVPDRRLATAVERVRGQVPLAHDGTSVRRDGRGSADLEPGATEVLLGAFDLLDHPADVGAVIARWIDRLAEAEPATDAVFLDVVSRHWLLHRIDALLEWMLPEVAAAVERLDRADRRDRLDEPALRARSIVALQRTARLMVRADQPAAGAAVGRLVDRLGPLVPPVLGPDPLAADALLAVASRLRGGDASAAVDLDALLASASATGTWPGPGPRGRTVGHDLAAAAATVHAARAMLVDDEGPVLALLPTHPDAWYGGKVELHDAPTAHGRISFAIRWHGTRPALLWELEPHEGDPPVTITIPGLDPTWSTTERRGDALLAEVPPPAGLAPIELVAEHPDIDPDMRRPGAEPTAPAPLDLPEGGTFS